MAAEDLGWTIVTAKRSALDVGLSELWQYRDLIRLFVRRNFVVNFRQTLFGPIWYLVQPLTTTAAFTVVFGMIARIPTDQIPTTLFYMSGTVLWSSFSINVTTTSDIFGANSAIFNKVYFPRLSVPIATILTNFVTLGLQLAVFIAVFGLEWSLGRAQAPALAAVLVVPIFVVNAVVGLGVGLLFSGLTTRYRDLMQVLGVLLQIWLYATPIIYPLSQVPERWRLLAAVNPISTSVELARSVLFSSGTVSIAQFAISVATGSAIVILGLVVFNRAAVSAVDTI